MQTKAKIRTSSSIAPFQEKAEKALGLERYNYKTDGYDVPVIFLGLYHKGDYNSFCFPRAKRYVLWSGGDIQNFKRGYYYGDGTDLWKSKIARFYPWRKRIVKTEAEHFCEDIQQKIELYKLGINAEVVPAFWGDINNFQVSFKPTEPFKIYICGHPKREDEYGFDKTLKIVRLFKTTEFHFYGAEVKSGWDNVINHGIVSEEQFNKEIRDYHCLLRLNEHDGFSDALSKSILLGQYSISRVRHKWIPTYENEQELIELIRRIRDAKKPFLKPREYYLKKFNKYPFL